jgi:hypothetical protein
MTKAFVDELVKNMKLAGIVAKVVPWSFEGYGDKQKSVRYIGLHLKDDWEDIFSSRNNILLKFVIDRTSGYLEYYLANKPPFLRIFLQRFTDQDKWEILLGELKRKLKKDKIEFTNHTHGIDNLYSKIHQNLK